jgi:hypothetical protein
MPFFNRKIKEAEKILKKAEEKLEEALVNGQDIDPIIEEALCEAGLYFDEDEDDE